jgi:hypothetical protein
MTKMRSKRPIRICSRTTRMVLTIRNEQMTVFETERRRRFEARALRYLQEMAAPDEDDEALRLIVTTAWEKAERYSLHNEHDVLRLVGLCHIFGADFDADPARPWIAEVLGRPRLTAESRIRLVWARLRAEG